ncbi:MAG: T9SS type A sorting domain-containing protein [Ignavibacterium sp.]|nr:T9SS type A sorting domain-containing protein [Ignavibacterium sp.]
MKIKILILFLLFISIKLLFAEKYIVINGPIRTTQCSSTKMARCPNYIRWINNTIAWKINENGCCFNDNISVRDLESAVKNGFNSWDTISTADFNFFYQGETDALFGNDGENLIYWAEENDIAFQNGGPLAGTGSGTLAITILTVNEYEEILDSDIIFNGRDHSWKVDNTDPDIWAVTSHEVGHVLGLFHTEVTNLPVSELPTMIFYYNSLFGRDLSFDDRVGASFLYGGNLIDDEDFAGNIYLKFDINILRGKSLNIQPGASIKMFLGASIRVRGQLNAIATQSQNISFINYRNNDIWSGIYFLAESQGSMNYCIVKNVNNHMGAAINIDCSSPKIQNCIIVNNTGYKGGIRIYHGSEPQIQNNVVAHNIANYGGGILCCENSNPVFINNTIAYNFADSAGGGLYCDSNSDPIFINNIFYGNTSSFGSQIYINDYESDPAFAYCNLQGGKEKYEGIGAGINYTGLFENNIDYDPSFVKAELDNFFLSDFSPCISSGIDSIEIAGMLYRMPPLCAGGNYRPSPIGTKPDIGAYENLLGSKALNEKGLPSLFLNQNYPNPFNPSTVISWQSPAGSHQTIKVFDVLGNEIATLVDEYKPAGRYIVEFSINSGEDRNLSSGVYFYRLKSGDFVQTRKMILIK